MSLIVNAILTGTGFSEYGTGFIGNDFSHQYDCINQVLGVGIPESVIALGGQYYYKNCGDMPDVMNAVFHYPKRGLTLTYDGTLKNGIYRGKLYHGGPKLPCISISGLKYLRMIIRFATRIMEWIPPNPSIFTVVVLRWMQSPLQQHGHIIKGGYGATYIDGKVIDASFLHVKEWIDAIRNQTETSCNIDQGFC